MLDYAEALSCVKLRWFYPEIDFLRGTESFYSTFLSFMFYSYNMLDRPYSVTALMRNTFISTNPEGGPI